MHDKNRNSAPASHRHWCCNCQVHGNVWHCMVGTGAVRATASRHAVLTCHGTQVEIVSKFMCRLELKHWHMKDWTGAASHVKLSDRAVYHSENSARFGKAGYQQRTNALERSSYTRATECRMLTCTRILFVSDRVCSTWWSILYKVKATHQDGQDRIVALLPLQCCEAVGL